MLDFIIYEKDKNLIEYYKIIILSSLAWHEDEFKIYEYEKYKNQTNKNKIYIICTENNETAIEKAKEIRNQNDWQSQIIIVSDSKNKDPHNNLLILDYIDINENTQTLLKNSITTAHKILSSQKSYNFLSNGEIHKIPYKDILYIEKRNNQNYCNIYTKTKEFITKNTIKEISEKLDSAYFMKTHRSCIVNLYNIITYNYSNNTISFENKIIDLISREKRQILKDKLLNM